MFYSAGCFVNRTPILREGRGKSVPLNSFHTWSRPLLFEPRGHQRSWSFAWFNSVKEDLRSVPRPEERTAQQSSGTNPGLQKASLKALGITLPHECSKKKNPFCLLKEFLARALEILCEANEPLLRERKNNQRPGRDCYRPFV